jgi:hypothetical protein
VRPTSNPFLAAAHEWARTEQVAAQRLSTLTPVSAELTDAPDAPQPSTAEVRAWARATGLTVPDRGRLRPEIFNAWRAAHETNDR